MTRVLDTSVSFTFTRRTEISRSQQKAVTGDSGMISMHTTPVHVYILSTVYQTDQRNFYEKLLMYS